MARLMIQGEQKLTGTLPVQGAKNSVLPILAAAILAEGEVVLENCPDLSDVAASIRILEYLGCDAKREGSTLILHSDCIRCAAVPDELMHEMRSSIVFLGAVVARCNQATLSYPGGCELGKRPIDLHLKGLAELGVQVEEDSGLICCHAPDGLHGGKIHLTFPSVGATENIMIAAALAKGTTILDGAAREPEIVDLANFLNACGARITGAGKSHIEICGVEKLHGCTHRIISDRIVAATYLGAAAITRGDIELTQVDEGGLSTILPLFERAGFDVLRGKNSLRIKPDGTSIHHFPKITTRPYPGFPTDAQALLMAVATRSKGSSIFVENIFEDRYRHVAQLHRFGAHIDVSGRVAMVNGVPSLHGAKAECTDLRGGAAVVLAALAAKGESEITAIHHIDRGYEAIETALGALGATIKRI